MTEEEEQREDARYDAEMADRYSLPKVMLRAEYSDSADALVLVAEIRRLQKLVEDRGYEYAVQRVSPVNAYVLGDRWLEDKEEQEAYLESLTRVLPEGVSYKLVMRKKAGPVEDV